MRLWSPGALWRLDNTSPQRVCNGLVDDGDLLGRSPSLGQLYGMSIFSPDFMLKGDGKLSWLWKDVRILFQEWFEDLTRASVVSRSEEIWICWRGMDCLLRLKGMRAVSWIHKLLVPKSRVAFCFWNQAQPNVVWKNTTLMRKSRRSLKQGIFDDG